MDNRGLSLMIGSVVLALAVGGLVVGVNTLNKEPKNPEVIVTNTPPSTSPSPSPSPSSILQERISWGDKKLLEKEFDLPQKNQIFQEKKDAGIQAMQQGDYTKAAQDFQAAIDVNHNAPETLIYLNNAQAEKASKKYTIAVVAPIKGDKNADLNAALEMLRGVAQAQDEINKNNGINGVPLKVIIANDDDDPIMAKPIALELVNNPNILGVVGHYSSGSTLAAGEAYNQGKLVTISPVSTATKLTKFSPYVWRTVPNDRSAGISLATHMKYVFKKETAIVFYNSDSAYSKSIKDEFVKQVNSFQGKILDEVDLFDPNFSLDTAMKKAVEMKAEVLMLAPNYGKLNEALLIVCNAKRRFLLLGGDAVYSPKTLTNNCGEAEGMVVAVAWHIKAHLNSDFAQNSLKLWGGGTVNWRTAMSYNAAQALIEALKTNPTRAGLQQAMTEDNFKFQGASGPMKFVKESGEITGDSDAPIQLVEIKKSRNSADDFFPVTK